MMRILACLCLLACTTLYAETLVIPVVGRDGWQITFDAPVPAMESLQPDDKGLSYRANAGRFNLSVFVETPEAAGGDSKACREHIWAKASQNPMIQKNSVKFWSAPKAECVEYVVAGEEKGGKFTQANFNCYFAHAGRWVDVHASFVTPTDADRAALKALAESLTYGPFPESKGGVQSFVLGDLGRLQITLPAAWRIGHMTTAQIADLPARHTISFFSATDPNKNWKMTFFKSATRYKSLESLMQMAKSAQQSVADDSVEQAVNLQEVKLKLGLGCHAEYTDASLADKPIQPGNAKVISSAFIAPVPDILGTVTIFADSLKDSDFLSAIQAVETIEWLPEKPD